MLKNIFLKSLKDSLLTILYIFITYFLVCMLIMYAVSELPLKEIQFIFDRLKIPEPLTTFISGPGGINFTTVEGILNTDMFTIFAPLVTIGFAIFFGYSSTKKEEEKRTLDIVLSTEISRSSFLIQKIASLIVKVFLISISLFMAILISAYFFGLTISIENIASVCFQLFLISTTFGLLAISVGTLHFESTHTYSLPATIAIISYIIYAIEPFLKSLGVIKYASLFYYYKGGDPLNNGLHSWHWVIFSIIICVTIFLSLYFWDKKDLDS